MAGKKKWLGLAAVVAAVAAFGKKLCRRPTPKTEPSEETGSGESD